ncbi:NgoMIV family type II restriction endonuclease [Buchananella felis]|uniref:NgoMIV family type II restriction endonuclease n=1 Tax=Buchananella felis TaxID=3231492 RepID=UPI0035275DC5
MDCATAGGEYELSKSLLSHARSVFHAALLRDVLFFDAAGMATNCDKSNRMSVSIGNEVAALLGAEPGQRVSGQRSGASFEHAVRQFLTDCLPLYNLLHPGKWEVSNVGSVRNTDHISMFEPYRHLAALKNAVETDPRILAVLGNSYSISPDVVVYREPLLDVEINDRLRLVDPSVGRRSIIRRCNQVSPILHAIVSCKWTLRSDRAQNARAEALSALRNRKGRAPHIVVVTGEPDLRRISSLALGTGDIDMVYHFALPELIDAVELLGDDDAKERLAHLVSGQRLRDIADLPLDLCV